MKFITITNQKGGVGKTSIAVHIASLAFQEGKKTLLVDLDGQRNSTFVTTRKKDHENTVINLWKDEPIITIKSCFGFDVLAGDEELFYISESGLVSSVNALRKLLNMEYDVIIFDTPPSQSSNQIAPLYLGGKLIIPIEPDIFAIQGLISILKIYNKVSEKVKLDLNIIINKKILNSTNQQKIIDALKSSHHKKYISDYELTARTLVPNSLKNGMTVWDSAKNDQSAKVWKSFCESVLNS